MFRIISQFMVLSLLTGSCLLAQDATITTWNGTLDARGTKLRLELDIHEDGEKSIGELRSLDQNNATFPIKVTKTENEITITIPQLGASFKGEFDAKKEKVVGTFTQSGAKLPLTIVKGKSRPAKDVKVQPSETLKEAWVGKLNMGVMNPIMQFRVMKSEADKPLCYFDSITEGATGFPGLWTIKDGKLSFKVPAIRLTYEGELNEAGDEATGMWRQAEQEFELVLKRQPTEYDNDNVWENRPQRPKEPFPYDTKEVNFDNATDDLTLAGTLTIPKSPGKHPAVILISGSGPQDRDETIMEHKPFLVLADYLSRRGIAVLRYDDRGTASSTGEFRGATSEAFARDASAAVEFLKSHERIDPEQIGLAGHSEGGLIAPMVCGLRDDVAFVVLMAATGVDGLEIIQSQTEAMLLSAASESGEFAEVEIGIKLNRLVTNHAAEGTLSFDNTDLKQKIDSLLEQLPAEERDTAKAKVTDSIEVAKKRLEGKWMKYFIHYDPRPALEQIECPVLAIIGSKDLQVLPDLNMPEIEKALRKGGNKDFEMVTLDGLNHLFQKCKTGSMDEYMTIEETWNPVALKRIGDWIEAHVKLLK